MPLPPAPPAELDDVALEDAVAELDDDDVDVDEEDEEEADSLDVPVVVGPPLESSSPPPHPSARNDTNTTDRFMAATLPQPRNAWARNAAPMTPTTMLAYQSAVFLVSTEIALIAIATWNVVTARAKTLCCFM